MRSMHHARQRAREERARVGNDSADLLQRLVHHMESAHLIAFVAMNPAQMRKSDAEVDGDRMLRFRNTLTDDERLVVFSHELGHVVLHKRLFDRDVVVDDIIASAYGDAGPAAIARYSPRVREEAEAKAFALEFLCPGALVLAQWRAAEPGTTIDTVAKSVGVDAGIAKIQLANALYDTATGADRPVAVARHEVRFTDEQVKAARHMGGPALVDAGPGTGKTATLIRRLEFALDEHGAAPGQVLVLTFSNEAVQELYERIEARFGADPASQMTIATFHGFGMEMLRWHREKVGLLDDFSLMDEDGQAELILELLGRVPCPALNPIRDPEAVADQVVKYVNHLKHRRISADELEAAIEAWIPAEGGRDDPEAGQELLALYREYEKEKLKRGTVDMADLILLPLRLLEEGGAVQKAYIGKFPWVLVDEFQDVTRATSDFLRAIAGGKSEPWVVGDARQAIYQFLGAAPDNVREFEANFPGSTTYPLRENHRASQPIVGAANQLASLFPKQGATDRWKAVSEVEPLGDLPVSIAEATSDHAEAEGVVDQIVEWQRAGVEAGDIAVLARRHVDVRSVVLALTVRGIKAESAGLLTADGAAGDLAVVLTLAARKPAASLPRLALALGRGRYTREEINATIQHLLRVERAKEGAEPGSTPEIAPGETASDVLLAEVAAARSYAEQEHFRADGFDCLMTFLFEGSAYLRRVLDAAESAERSMTLMEVVSTLSLATAYRITHPGGEGSGKRHHSATRSRSGYGCG
ncbi:MAG: UvrD/Rep-family ATP-dependent helicase [Gemmatimonadetes bacterium]|nr:UvrD/Rep-family ATP-dependent helicase [Gemmatimonadota bacterium]